MKTFSFTTSAEQVGMRVDAVLAAQYAQYSRATWSACIKQGHVLISGKPATPSQKLKLDAKVSGNFPVADTYSQLIAPKVLPEVLYQDDDVIVINKPPGLVVHPTENNSQPSVVGAFESLISDKSESLRPGVVHRLDKDTSGVMILARTTEAKDYLQAQFKARTVDKHYTALVEGHLDSATARVELPIARNKKNPQKMNIDSQGKSAISEYKVIKQYQARSLIDIALFTGRTHQIRVQFAHLGHPIVGDKLYGFGTQPRELPRQFLHANTLGIILPSGDRKIFVAPLASDLQTYLNFIS